MNLQAGGGFLSKTKRAAATVLGEGGRLGLGHLRAKTKLSERLTGVLGNPRAQQRGGFQPAIKPCLLHSTLPVDSRLSGKTVETTRAQLGICQADV